MRIVGDFSPIHLLSILTLIGLPRMVMSARAGNVTTHRRVVLLLFFGALVAAGIFAFMPGRIMYRVVAGG